MDLAPTKVDRQTTTPFYLKLFYKAGGFHRPEEFSSSLDLLDHVQIYTWQTCTLRELSHLLISALPSLVPSPSIGTRLSFRLTFPDTRNSSSVGPGRYMTKDLGSIVIGDGGPGILPDDEEAAIVSGGIMAGPVGGEPERTLQDAKFVIGDYVCCAVLPPLENGGVAPPVAGVSRGGYAGGGGIRGGGDFGRGGFGRRDDGGFGGGYRGGRGGIRGGAGGGGYGQGSVPVGEWRRGERVPEGPSGGGGGRGRGYGGGYGGGRGGRW